MINIIHKKLHFILSWTAVLLWLVLIFNLSAQPREQSNNLSTGVTEIIIETVERVVPNIDFDIEGINHLVRKNAHFFAYLLLGILVMNAFRKSRFKIRLALLLTLIFCVLFAASDELHQLFVSGRGPQVADVLLDSTGVIVGIGIYVLIGHLIRLNYSRPRK